MIEKPALRTSEQIVAPKQAVVDLDHAVSGKAPKRLTSLDAFRGLTIFLMLLVNNIALDIYTPDQFVHAKWNAGLRLADLVFPWFLFCVGVSIPFSVASFKRKGLSKTFYIGRAVMRCIVLVLLGCVLDSAVVHHWQFGLGVLQLIGLAYLLGALCSGAHPAIRLVIALGLLAGYGLFLRFQSMPGTLTGTFLENRNAAQYFNDTYLASYKLQGLLSAIPTGGLVIIGTLIGEVLQRQTWGVGTKFGVLLLAGFAMMASGTIWNSFLPYNKPVWTPAYILVSGGAATIILVLLYAVMDGAGWKAWAFPALVFGANAILAYVAPIFVKVLLMQTWMMPTSKGTMPMQQAMLDALTGRFGRIQGGWAYTGLYIAAWWLVLFILYRKRVFVRI